MIKLTSITKDILNEGLTDILYHFTGINPLLNILKEKKIHASSNIGSSHEARISKGKFFSLSTTRTLATGFYIGSSRNVCLVLDGRKLGQRYKGFPIDYWKYSTKQSDWGDVSSYINALKAGEQEDRIVLNSPTIDDAIKYILEIHIMIRDSEYIHSTIMNAVIGYTDMYKIPTYYYDNVKYYKYQQKSKAVDINTIEFPDKVSDPVSDELKKRSNSKIPYGIVNISALLSYKNDLNYAKLMKFYATYDDFMEKMNDTMKQFPYNILKSEKYLYEYDINSYTDTMSAYTKTIKTDSDDDVRFILKMLADDMRKYKVGTLEEYIKLKMGKK